MIPRLPPSFLNNLYASTFLFAEHWYLQTSQAYNTITSKLYYSPDPTLPAGYVAYSFPIKQLVYDSGVSGAFIFNEVSGGVFAQYPLTRASGIHIDYENARAILPLAYGTGLSLTGTASYKEVNIYQPNETEEEILTQNKFFLNPRYRAPLVSGVPPYVYATPAMFLNPLQTHNDPYQFGGTVESKTTMTFTVLAETSYQLNNLLSTFADTEKGYFPLVGVANDPLDEWGDVKGGTGYNYFTLAQRYGTPGNLVYINRVRGSKVSDRVRMNPRQFCGIIDMEVFFVRLPPALT